MVVGGGTYVRSLARDISKELGTVGYASFINRTRYFFENGKVIDTSAALPLPESEWDIDQITRFSFSPLLIYK